MLRCMCSARFVTFRSTVGAKAPGASKAEPQYEIKSDKTAAHKEGALTKIGCSSRCAMAWAT